MLPVSVLDLVEDSSRLEVEELAELLVLELPCEADPPGLVVLEEDLDWELLNAAVAVLSEDETPELSVAVELSPAG